MKEKSLIILKPDAVMRGLTGEIIARFERKGLKIVAAKFEKISLEKAENHYAEHDGKPFYPKLINFITSAPVMLMVLEGNNAISVVRTLLGKTNGCEAAPGSIRGDYGTSKSFNAVHASDSAESAIREIENFFTPAEIVEYERPEQVWLFSEDE